MHESDLGLRPAWPARRAPGGAVLRFGAAAALLLPVAWGAGALAAPGGGPVAAAAFAALAGTAGLLFARRWTHGRMGPANLVTLGRAALASSLAAPALLPGPVGGEAWAPFALAAAAFALDGVDGALARRTGLATAWGGRFDMEADAVLAALLSLVALRWGEAGPLVLVLGFMRYGFAGLGLALPWLLAPLPESRRRKAVCVVQIATLIALLAPPVAPPLSGALVTGATALLAWSFAVDVLRLARA